MKNILVTGAAGFIGEALDIKLRELGYNVLAFDSQEDISETDMAKRYCDENIFHVFHLAAKTFVPESWENPVGFYKTSVLGTNQVLELCRKKNIPLTFISAYLYGEQLELPISERATVTPNNPYAHSKYLAEELCRFYSEYYGVKITIARPFNAYGKKQKENFLIPIIINQVLHDSKIVVKSLEPKRDYIYLDDLVDGLIKTIEITERFSIYNFGSGSEYSVKEIIDIVQNVAGTNKPIVSDQTERKNEIMHVIADISKAKEELGWSPRFTFEDGITEILKSAIDVK